MELLLKLTRGMVEKGPAIKPLQIPGAIVSVTLSPLSNKDEPLGHFRLGRFFIWKAFAPSINELIALSLHGMVSVGSLCLTSINKEWRRLELTFVEIVDGKGRVGKDSQKEDSGFLE